MLRLSMVYLSNCDVHLLIFCPGVTICPVPVYMFAFIEKKSTFCIILQISDE